MSGKPLRALLVEDSENDVMLLLRELKKGGYEPDYRRVQTPEEMEEALGEGSWEVVLSDYNMPRFGAGAALEVLRGAGHDTPFVVVSGKIGEDAVVEMLRAGAQDYVTKEDMARLCPAIERELREVEERRRAEEALHFLSEASTELSSSLDYRSTLARVARLTVPRLADWCAVDVLEEDVGVHRLAVEHQDPEKVAWAHELQERYPPDEDAPRGLFEVLRSGRSDVYPEIPDQMLVAAARDPEHLRIMRELGFTSAMIVPLVARGRTLGAITLVSAESGRRYGRADLELAEELASRAALAVDNARLYDAAQREITERKRAETRYRTLVEQIPAVTYIQEPLESATPKAVTYMSPQYETMFGYPARSEVMDEEHWLRTLHPEDRERVLAEEARTDQTGRPFGIEYRMFARDGSVVWVRDEAVLVRDEEGGSLYWLGIQYDITERKRFEEALKTSEELYRTVVEQAAENIFLVDVGSRCILEANAALVRSLGYSAEELKGMSLYDVVAHDRESIDFNVGRVVAEKSRFIGERRYRRKDGTLVDLEVSVSALTYRGREVMCIVAHDVTQRKQAEDDLRRNLSVLLALREAGQVLGSTLQSEEIATRLLEIMRGVAGLTAAATSRIDHDGEIHLWRSVGVENLWPRARFAPEAVNARQTVLESGARLPVRLRNPDSPDERLVALYLPLKIKDSIVGVLEAYGSESLAQNDTVEVVSSLTSQAASALENAQLYEKLSSRERALQDLVGKLLGAQEEERRRVAYEVHDGLAQVAVAAHQHLQAFARRYAPEAESGRRDLERILRLVRGTVSDARRIIANLRPTTLDDLGLAATLSLEVERLREEGYRVDYEENLGEGRLPVTAEITLFRVAQEALTNMRKHAKAELVRIELRYEGPEVHLEIRDYGRGFEPGTASLGSGPGERVGLAGMRERMGMIGGTLEVRSSPGAGTSVTASVPLGAWRSP